MTNFLLALEHLLKDLFTQPRTNFVTFYVDGAGEPIVTSFDFQIDELPEFIEQFMIEFPFEGFQYWLDKSKLNHKASREYQMSYGVDWKGSIIFKHFSS